MAELERSQSETAKLLQSADTLAASQQREKILLDALESLQREVRDLQAKLNGSALEQQQTQSQLGEKLTQTELRLDEQATRLADLSDTVQVQGDGFSSSKVQIDQIAAKVDEALAYASNLKQMLDETARQTGLLDTRLSEMATGTDGLAQQARELSQQVEQGKQTDKAMSGQMTALSERIDQSAASLNELANTVAAQSADLAQRAGKETALAEEVTGLQQRVAKNEQRVDEMAVALPARLSQMESDMSVLEKVAKDAMELAAQEEIRAKGKLAFAVILTEDKTLYPLNLANLGMQDKAALAGLVDRLKDLGTNYHLEIEGHTDNIGVDDYNYHLGMARAEVVKRHLHETGHVSLNKMSVISYGATQPAPAGMPSNRRIVIKVLVLEDKK